MVCLTFSSSKYHCAFLLLSFILFICACDSAVTAPIDSTDSIRINSKLPEAISKLQSNDEIYENDSPKLDSKGFQSKLEQIEKKRIELEELEHQLLQNEKKILQKRNMRINTTPSPPKTKSMPNSDEQNINIQIQEPPDGSYIWGGHFDVHININPDSYNDLLNNDNLNDYGTTESGTKKNDSIDDFGIKVCVSLDNSPWYCWPIENARLHFFEATEGEHTIVAKLYKNETFINGFTTPTVTFTTVNDPDFLTDPEKNLFNHPDSPYDLSTSSDTDKNDEKVSIEMPQIEMMSPVPFTTYPGTQIPIRTTITVNDRDVSTFKNMFKFAFLCVNIDNSTAYAGFPLFEISSSVDDEKRKRQKNSVSQNELELAKIPPLVVDLLPGRHTFQVALSHPDTHTILGGSKNECINLSSKNETKIQNPFFYLSGNEEENATMSVDVKVDQAKKKIALIEGSDINFRAQSKYFCESIGNTGNQDCFTIVFSLLKESWKKKFSEKKS